MEGNMATGFITTGGTAATGIHDKIIASATTGLHEGHGERVLNTASKATAGVATANADQMMIVEGILVVSTSWNLVLTIGSELSAITVQAGTFMELNKIS